VQHWKWQFHRVGEKLPYENHATFASCNHLSSLLITWTRHFPWTTFYGGAVVDCLLCACQFRR
jgi:hypothetical protein